MQLTPLVLVIFAVAILANAGANILMGYGMKDKPLTDLGIVDIFFKIVLSAPFILGVTCFGIALIAYNYVLNHVPLSRAYPIMTSLGFVLVLFVTQLWGGREVMYWQQWVGVAMILGGVWLISSKLG